MSEFTLERCIALHKNLQGQKPHLQCPGSSVGEEEDKGVLLQGESRMGFGVGGLWTVIFKRRWCLLVVQGKLHWCSASRHHIKVYKTRGERVNTPSEYGAPEMSLLCSNLFSSKQQSGRLWKFVSESSDGPISKIWTAR